MRRLDVSPRYPDELVCDALTSTGSVVQVRPIRPEDAPALSEFHEHLSRETVYRRFFNPHPHLRPDELVRLTNVDFVSRLALVTLSEGNLVGVARYDSAPGSDEAEVAFVIADDWQGHGLGTLMLEHLAAAGRRRGVARFVADTLSTNDQMQDVFRHAGFARRSRFDGGVVRVDFPIHPTAEYHRCVTARYVSAAAAWSAGRVATGRALPGDGPETVLVTRRQSAVDELEAAVPLLASLVSDDVCLGLAALAGLHPQATLVLDGFDPVRQPGRLLALMRSVSRSQPLAVVAPDSDLQRLCDQAGVVRVDDLASVAGALERAAAVVSGPDRAEPAEVEGCDIGAARQRLAEAGEGEGDVLHPDAACAVLDAYGVDRMPSTPLRAVATPGPAGSWRLKVGRPGGAEKFLPLTLSDAREISGADPEPALRLARLLDDQPDIADVVLDPAQGPVITLGPVRDLLDDPLYRRLPPA